MEVLLWVTVAMAVVDLAVVILHRIRVMAHREQAAQAVQELGGEALPLEQAAAGEHLQITTP